MKMSGKEYVNEFTEISPGEDCVSSISILAVGEPGDWKQQGNTLPRGGLTFVGISDVTSHMLDQINPTVIYSPVLASTFDCIELATLLHQLGYSGAYRAFATSLPKPELIEREVRQICGRLDFRIVVPDI